MKESDTPEGDLFTALVQSKLNHSLPKNQEFNNFMTIIKISEIRNYSIINIFLYRYTIYIFNQPITLPLKRV